MSNHRPLSTQDRAAFIVRHREVLDWRDRQLLKIEYHLTRRLPGLVQDLRRAANETEAESGLFTGAFLRNRVEPLVRAWSLEQARVLLASARDELESVSSPYPDRSHREIEAVLPLLRLDDQAPGIRPLFWLMRWGERQDGDAQLRQIEAQLEKRLTCQVNKGASLCTHLQDQVRGAARALFEEF